MDWDKLDASEKKKYIEKGYKDLRFVLLRNGGMFHQYDDTVTSFSNTFWKYYPYAYLAVYCFVESLLLYSLYYERGNVDNILEAAHYVVMIWSLSVGNIDFLYYRKDVNTLLRYVGTEFFQYDEDEPELYKKMKYDNVREVKKMSTLGTIMYYFMGFFISVVQPSLLYWSTKDNLVINSINPYLPVPMYFPWNTYTLDGYITAYLIHFFGSYFVVKNVVANGFSYVNLMIILRCQFQILNHSILNIESRAVERFKRKYGSTYVAADLCCDLEVEIKKSLCECLKDNIRHHQCLMRWEITSRKMLRVILLFVFFNASILMASTGYLLIKNMNSKIRTFKFVQLLVLEIFHTFLFCYYGEQVVTQSEDLFHNLFRISWFNYGKQFNSMLSVMLTKTVKPMKSLTAIFNTPCTLETFNSLMSNAYSYFNLLKQAKEGL